jgi:hypothetical protein
VVDNRRKKDLPCSKGNLMVNQAVLLPDWGDSMEVIIHLPCSTEGQEDLSKRVATVHAQLIYNYISRLACSTEQTVALLDAIQKNIHDEIKKEKEG